LESYYSIRTAGKSASNSGDFERVLVQISAIINPVSGAGLDTTAAGRRASLLTDRLRHAGLTASIHFTERAGHARELAAGAVSSRADLVIVWGGDGTLNEAGAALVNSSTALGLVPAGSGNGLAAALGTPRDPEAAIARILAVETTAIDVGLINNRAFFNIAGIGFDAHIARLFNARRRGKGGKWPYLAIGVREGYGYRSQNYRLELDGNVRDTCALLIAFANGREYGMGARISPQALLDDGWLEATVVEDRPFLARFMHARHLAAGSIERAPRVHAQKVRRAVVTTDGMIEFHVDGEPDVAKDQVEVTILPGALRVRR
jgi:diacylglycerol kinase (ATP)